MGGTMTDPTKVQGLDDAQVQARLRAEGPNELPRAGHRTPWRVVRDVLREPMLALLLAGGGIYLLLGDTREAVILLLSAHGNAYVRRFERRRIIDPIPRHRHDFAISL